MDEIGTQKLKIEYKYVVYSSKVSIPDHGYEYLYYCEQKKCVYNRCFSIDRNIVEKGWHFHTTVVLLVIIHTFRICTV